MKKRLSAWTALILCAGFIGFFAVTVAVTRENNLNLAKDMVTETTRICAALYDRGADLAAVEQPGQNVRVTIIAADGRVLSDSMPLDVDAMENHLNRPEIQAAQKGEPLACVRRSETLGVDMIYYAAKAANGDFVRAAMPVAKAGAYVSGALPPLLLTLAAAALACFFVVRGVSGRVAAAFGSVEQKLRLLLSGGYEPGIPSGGYEEIESVAREIDGVAGLLQNAFGSLRDEKNKLDYILNNIADGLFTVDESGNIAQINAAAMGIFDVTPEIAGKRLNYLTFNEVLTTTVEDCLANGKNALAELTLSGRVFLVTVKPLPDTRPKLTMVILSDITAGNENAKQREEFFANSSHELKTPLTAIKGFNELAALNNKDDGIVKYIDGIARETERMLSLIGDMLKLSELENTKVTDKQSVSLAKIVGEAREAVLPAINEKSIVFTASGDAVIMAEPDHVYETVKNLIENAVRYNNPGGSVTVTAESDRRGARLIVRDNGIGISPDEQTRIFERFYRVEKSRCGRNGGTGLGLAIVKHVCALYSWKLSLKSRPGAGTEITVEMPR